MLSLRYPWVWLALGWVLVVGVCIGSVLPGNMLAGMPLSDKYLHAGSYFLLMVWFAGLYARRRHVVIAFTLLVLGIGLEVVQGRLPYREFSLFDVLANASGIMVGLGLSLWALEGWCVRVERRLFARSP